MDHIEPKTGSVNTELNDAQAALYASALGQTQTPGSPDDSLVFESSLHACLVQAAGDHAVIPIFEADDRLVQPAGWSDWYRVLEVEPLDGQHVRIWWDSLNGPLPGDVSTVFRRDEWVIAR